MLIIVVNKEVGLEDAFGLGVLWMRALVVGSEDPIPAAFHVSQSGATRIAAGKEEGETRQNILFTNAPNGFNAFDNFPTFFSHSVVPLRLQ